MLADQRITRWADVLVDYCLRLRSGDLMEISADPSAFPLVMATYRRALQAGAHPFWNVEMDDLTAALFEEASDDQLAFMSPLDTYRMNTIDARLVIRGGSESFDPRLNSGGTHRAAAEWNLSGAKDLPGSIGE